MTESPDPRRGPTRRAFLESGLLAGLSLGLSGGPRLFPFHARSGEAPARSVIHLFLSGGLSHVDTFDPKPDAPVEVRGPYDPIASRLDGVRVSEALRRTARVMDRFTLLRAVHHSEAAHERGVRAMLTGYKPSPAILHPSLGAVCAHELPPRGAIPSYVAIPDAREPALGTGYLGAAHGPFSVGGDPSGRRFSVRDLAPPKDLEAERLERRKRFLEMMDGDDDATAADAERAMGAFYARAFELVDAPEARAAFDLGKEKRRTRDAYGNSRVGQGLLLARRLAAAGVRYVAVREGGFDHHRDLERGLDRRLPDVDKALAALVSDLEDRGQLSSTLVVVTTEFGRTPRINSNRGRDHWPRCFSVALAGAGLKAGLVHGVSDAEGAEPDQDGVGPADLAATIFELSGIEWEKRLMAPGDRPIDIVRDGRPIEAILAGRGSDDAHG